MTGDDFNQVSAFLASEVQRTLKTHFSSIGVTAVQADAMVSALAMVVGMFAAQDTSVRSVFSKVLDHSVEAMRGNERLRRGTETLRDGGTPERDLNMDIPDLWPVVQQARANAAHSGCLHCAIRKAITERFGNEVRDVDHVRLIFGNLARVAAELICDVGPEALAFFNSNLSGHISLVQRARSTEGMKKQ